jgi:RNA polymerase sigma factor (sigma-70 family)
MAQSDETQPSSDDQMLLQQMTRGDKSAFWELWLRYKDRLYRICLQFMNGSRQDAEDALSCVMLKAFEKLPAHVSKVRDFRSWMSKFTRNACIDIVRKRQREEIRVCGFEEGPAIPVPFGDENPNLTTLLEKISPCQQEIIVCRFIEKKDYLEIAQELNIPSTAARKRAQRARATLKRIGAELVLENRA